MNFTFADISSVYLNMVQKDLPKDTMLESNSARTGIQSPGKHEPDRPEPEKQLFAEKLHKTLQKSQSVPAENLVPDAQDGEKIVEFLSEKLGHESGSGFAAALKNIFIMLSKGDLKNISLDSEGLDALKKMLVGSGFKEGDIDELILELSQSEENSQFPIDSFFDGLFKLSAQENIETETNPDAFLETSFIPVLESIFISLGIPTEKIQEIFAAADKGEAGISLDEVIANLKSVQKTSFYNYTHYQTQNSNENILQVLKQLGLGTGEGKASDFSLDDLVASLESLRKEMSSGQTDTSLLDSAGQKGTGEKPLELLNKLFKGLKIENEPTQKPAFEFSVQQIKDQFKNGLGVLNEESLASEIKSETGSSLKAMFKEMAALLDEKKNDQAVDPNTLLKETKAVLKQMKTSDSKGADLPQATTSDLKSNDFTANMKNLKSNTPLKNLPNFVTQQVGRSMVRAINQGENTLRIQLKPPELGRLMMTIDNSGNTMKVSIVTESLAAKEILTSNATELKSVLSNSGVNLEKFEVDMNSDFRQSMADARHQAQNFSKRRQNREKAMAGENNLEGIDDGASILDALNQDSSLHYVA